MNRRKFPLLFSKQKVEVSMFGMEQILSKCEQYFMRNGLKSTTMDDVCRFMGISKKTLYQFIEQKSDLIHRIVQRRVQEEQQMAKAILIESENAIDELMRISRHVHEKLQQTAPSILYDLQKYYHRSWELMEQHRKDFVVGMIKANIERGMKEGLYRNDLQTDLVTAIFSCALAAMVDEGFYAGNEYKPSEAHRVFIDYHIRGIASERGMELYEGYLRI
ncbi:MAG: TetR/AcrR family transcriptional regulator [Saprospiraceae bacterium]|nr:TetR/AcrR family transcriptional regulator [Saprospiraceae bacterium]MDZ4705591.1 TetR/AcrR family transcriptional regulator [Saprospiraceae bacterium]